MTDSEGVGNEIQAEDLEGDLSLDSERSENVIGGMTTKKANKLSAEIDGVNVTKGML